MKAEDWKEVEQALCYPGAVVHLQCDGYLVSLHLQRNKMRLVIVLYVNGVMKGEWFRGECEEGRRFFRGRSECALRFKPSDARKLGKKWVADMKAKHTHSWREPIWTSLSALRRHFEKHNTSIERISHERYTELQGSAA